LLKLSAHMTRTTERKLASPPPQRDAQPATNTPAPPEKDWKAVAERATLHASVAGYILDEVDRLLRLHGSIDPAVVELVRHARGSCMHAIGGAGGPCGEAPTDVALAS
jgi:hypothetical protein